MQSKILIPREMIVSEGNISYSEGLQAWNTIRFRREMLNDFPVLKEKRSKFSYKLVYHKDIQKAIEELKTSKITPFFLFVYKNT